MNPARRRFAKPAGPADRMDVLQRIKQFEEAIAKARAYLETGKHADWQGFRPWFARKFRDRNELPPHKDWVRNVYLPRLERAMKRAEKVLDRLG